MKSQAQDLEEAEQQEKQAPATRRPLEEIDEDIGSRISNRAAVQMEEKTRAETETIAKADKEAMRLSLIQVVVESVILMGATHSLMMTPTRVRECHSESQIGVDNKEIISSNS